MDKVYVVYDTYLDDEPIMDIVREEDIAQYKERKFEEWEKRIKNENEVVLSMTRKDEHWDQYNEGYFEIVAIRRRHKNDKDNLFLGYQASYKPMTIWSK